MGRTIITITTCPVDWSPKKLVEMKRDIIVFLAQQSAPNAKWIETPVGLDGRPVVKEATSEQEPLIRLKCSSCGDKKTWYAGKFTPCPSCNQRNTVRKAKVQREIPPAGAIILPA